MSTRRSNRIQLEGNLGKDADHKKTDKSEVVKFSLAVNERWMDKSKVEHKRTDWFFVEVWGPAASFAAGLKKGTPVSIEGKVRTGEYTGEDGVKRPTWAILADSIRKIDYGKSEANPDAEDGDEFDNNPPF